MSGEMIAIIAAAIALASVMVPGMRGMRRDMQHLEVRLTERMSEHETRLTERMSEHETRLTERMSALEARLTERMTRLETTLTERVARLEGLFEGSMRSRKPRKTRH
ncbi:MAG: hypothetical protein F4Y74_13240 [Gemmatimonadales bacterium]|nr:hypothetical protein [Gemmatimonadales bacterium]MYG18809.1 hypothetical protein [Gemmatimonadales bacterium]